MPYYGEKSNKNVFTGGGDLTKFDKFLRCYHNTVGFPFKNVYKIDVMLCLGALF